MSYTRALARAAADYLACVGEYRSRFKSVPSAEQLAMDRAEEKLRREIEYAESVYEGRFPHSERAEAQGRG